MDASIPFQDAAPQRAPAASATAADVPQYGRMAVLAVWAAAALPMAALAWLVAPGLAGALSGYGDVPMFQGLVIALSGGLAWQFVLVVVLVWREQRTLRWAAVRRALWLRPPSNPRGGRRGGRLWLIVLPLIAAYALLPEIVPTFPAPPRPRPSSVPRIRRC